MLSAPEHFQKCMNKILTGLKSGVPNGCPIVFECDPAPCCAPEFRKLNARSSEVRVQQVTI